MTTVKSLAQAVQTIQHGGIIAYPTEAVFGLGCDPYNEAAVHRLCQLKQRPVEKGLILIAASWKQLEDLTQPITPEQQQRVFATWPGHHTWVFPANSSAPKWICGPNHTVAVRITDHLIAKSLCERCNSPLVSTSANLAGKEPARTPSQVAACFENQIDCILDAELGNKTKPSIIRDAVSGKLVRA